MSRRILWIDNDRIFLSPHVHRLVVEGYAVEQAFTLSEGLEKLKERRYDLVILDVMVPVREQEEDLFPPGETDLGRKSGLAFYRRFRGMRGRRKPTLMV